MKANQVWDITKGSGATVAVIDTGVASLPDTQGSLLPGADFSSGTTTSGGNGQTDLDGHGTAMAVTIAGAGNVTTGLAPAAKILPVRVTLGEGESPDVLAAGIQYAISQHVSVINLSQVASSENSTLADAIQDALNNNIVMVAGSGNNGNSTVSYPAAYSGVIAVGAVDQSGTLWSDSDTGPQVTLTAPGVNIPQEDETGAAITGTGTSASTAYVSATAALIRSAHPSWTAGQVIRDLITTAEPAAGQVAGQHSDQYGFGIVDPLKALEAAAPSETSNPLLASTGSAASVAPTAGATSGAAGRGTASSSSSNSSTGVLIGIFVAVIVIILIIVLIVALSRRNRNRPGGPGTGGPGGGGAPRGGQYPQQNPYGQQQQQNPYQPQNPYGQQQPQYPYPPQDPSRGQPPQR